MHLKPDLLAFIKTSGPGLFITAALKRFKILYQRILLLFLQLGPYYSLLARRFVGKPVAALIIPALPGIQQKVAILIIGRHGVLYRCKLSAKVTHQLSL